VASEEQAVLAHPLLTTRLNESRLAAYFALDVPSDGSTFFADVSELLPAHVMVIDEETVRTRRYWEPDPRAVIHYRSDAEYAEHFRTLLKQSVVCRLRAPTPPVAMMSGGLDSTAVAALAAQRLSKTNPHTALRALSYVFNELPSCDERVFMTAMYARHPIEGVQIPGDDAWPLREVVTWPTSPNTPENNPYCRLKERVYLEARRGESRVVLTGIFGDELYSGAEYWLRESLGERDFVQAWQEGFWHFRQRGNWDFLRRSVLCCLPGLHWLRRRYRTRRQSWLTAHARSHMPADDEWSVRIRRAFRPSQFDTLLGPYSATDSAREIFHASRCGVELRHPYRDRRLVEFMLAIPASQLYRRGRYKYILRNAMRGTLPEQIHTRREPTSLAPLFLRGLVEKERATVKGLLYGPERLWPRYIRADWLALADPGHRRSEAEELVVWLCLCCELWHQSIAH
jgi:asparagine synthase (glutamine-hydrolysing)